MTQTKSSLSSLDQKLIGKVINTVKEMKTYLTKAELKLMEVIWEKGLQINLLKNVQSGLIGKSQQPILI